MDKLSLIKDWLLSQYNSDVIFAVLYGSHVYGTSTPDSDYDLYVVLKDTYNIIVQADTLPFDIKSIGHIDITLVSEKYFLNALKENDVKAMEAIFVPPRYVVFGDQSLYRSQFECYHPYLRNTYGKVCRNAWDRGSKKLTKETDPNEIKIGKKSLYHAIRLFICADQLYTNGEISFEDQKLEEAKTFYGTIKDKPIDELVENGKLKEEYINLYKQYDKEFRKIPNEEQYKQLLKKNR